MRRRFQARPWFVIAENLAVDLLLWTSFIDSYIHDIFPTEWGVMPMQPSRVEILTSFLEALFPLQENVQDDGLA